MGEKKVGSRRKKERTAVETEQKIQTEKEYESFVAEFGAELRKRTTQVVSAPLKKTRAQDRARDSFAPSRCAEMDPHTTVNPAAEHQILTKRTGRILSDDTGFKAKNYQQRFELQPEMADLAQNEDTDAGEFGESAIPGQQTMADMVASAEIKEEISVPIESQIASQEPPGFADVYQGMKQDGAPVFGKSEKLRAIARTAADDALMNPENQLALPGFESPFVMQTPEKKEKKRGKKTLEHPKRKKNRPEAFDIDESELVTNHSGPAETDAPSVQTSAAAERQKKQFRIFETLKNSREPHEADPPFEIGGKGEIREALQKLKSFRRTDGIKTVLLLVFGVFLLIVSLIFDKTQAAFPPKVYAGLHTVGLLAAGVTMLRELLDGARDVRNLRFSANAGGFFIFFSSLLQLLAAFFAPDSIRGAAHLLTPAAVFSLIAMKIPPLLLTNHAVLTAGLLAGREPVSVFKSASDGGVEGTVKGSLSAGAGYVRYAAKAQFVTGLLRRLTNAVPKPLGNRIFYGFSCVFAILAGVACGIMEKSVFSGVTAFTGMLMACLPVSYAMMAAMLLRSSGNALAEKKSSLISYRVIKELTETKAMIFDASELVEQPACSIHNILPFGGFSQKRAALYCAAVIRSCGSPLEAIMNEVIAQGQEDVPEPEEILVAGGSGVAAIIDGHKVLLGTRAFLEENHVFLPERNFEEEYVTGDRRLLYFSVNGEFTMLLITSYHIKRSVAAFLKYMSGKGIRLAVYSADPNLNAAYVAKKCRLEAELVADIGAVQASYFRDKAGKVDTALPTEAFTDGSLTALSELFRRAFSLNAAISNLPLLVYAFSALNALWIAALIFLRGVASVGNFGFMAIKILFFALACLIAFGLAKKEK